MRAGTHGAAHFAVFAGLYVVGAVVCLAQVTGLDTRVDVATRVVAAALAFCTASGVYLLDRVKLRDAWLDPADAQAHPARFGFLATRSRGVRVLALVLLMCAAWAGWWLHPPDPLGALVPVGAALGVLAYAGRPRGARARPKDVVLVKNVYVAAGITGFALLVVVVGAQPGVGWRGALDGAVANAPVLGLACALLAARVFADAVLCDLDDEASDRRHGTATLPTRLGRWRAWNVATAARLGIAAAIAVVPLFPLHARLAWACATAASSVALRVANPAHVRDWVDARLGLEAAAVTAALTIVGA